MVQVYGDRGVERLSDGVRSVRGPASAHQHAHARPSPHTTKMMSRPKSSTVSAPISRFMRWKPSQNDESKYQQTPFEREKRMIEPRVAYRPGTARTPLGWWKLSSHANSLSVVAAASMEVALVVVER